MRPGSNARRIRICCYIELSLNGTRNSRPQCAGRQGSGGLGLKKEVTCNEITNRYAGFLKQIEPASNPLKQAAIYDSRRPWKHSV
jgi:hypothetical protein